MAESCAPEFRATSKAAARASEAATPPQRQAVTDAGKADSPNPLRRLRAVRVACGFARAIGSPASSNRQWRPALRSSCGQSRVVRRIGMIQADRSSVHVLRTSSVSKYQPKSSRILARARQQRFDRLRRSAELAANSSTLRPSTYLPRSTSRASIPSSASAARHRALPFDRADHVERKQRLLVASGRHFGVAAGRLQLRHGPSGGSARRPGGGQCQKSSHAALHAPRRKHRCRQRSEPRFLVQLLGQDSIAVQQVGDESQHVAGMAIVQLQPRLGPCAFSVRAPGCDRIVAIVFRRAEGPCQLTVILRRSGRILRVEDEGREEVPRWRPVDERRADARRSRLG